MTAREMRRALILYFLTAGVFLFPLFAGSVPYIGDMTRSFQPWLTYAAQEIQAGRLPQWNPYTACGEPFMANPQVMTMSPLGLLFWMFPFGRAYAFFLAAAHGLLFFGSYLASRAWLSSKTPGPSHGPALLTAVAMTWGAFGVAHWEFPSAVGTLGFLPFLFLFGWAGSGAGVTLATAAALATGYVQFVHYGVFAAFVGWMVRARSTPGAKAWVLDKGRFVLALAAAAVLVLPQIVASWDAARESLRAALDATDARQFLLSPVFAIKILVPWITNPVALAFQSPPFDAGFWPVARPWLSTFFVGTGVALLGVTGFFRAGPRKTLALFLLVSGGLALALGVDPVFDALRRTVPGLRYMTHFANAAILAVFALTLAAGEAARRTAWRNGLLIFLTLGALAVTLGLSLDGGARAHLCQRLLGTTALTAVQDRWVSAAAGGAAASLLFFGALWLMFHQRRWAVAGTFTTLELWLLARALNPLAPDGFYHRPLALTKELAAAPHRLALAPNAMKSAEPLAGDNLLDGYHSLRQSLYPNVPLPHRVPQTWSHEVFGGRRFVEYRRRVPDLPGPSAALDFLGTSHIVSIEPLPGPSRFLAQSANALLYTRPRPLERVTWVPRARVVPDDAERLKIIETGWDPRNEVLLESPGPAEGSEGQTTEWAEEPGRVTARGRGAGWLVYSGVHAPGWRAFVNGQPTAIARANHAFMALRVPAGEWRALWVYRTPALAGALGAVFFLVFGAFGWGFRKLRTY
ncbi:MAG: hypothetical protein IPO76_10505 [Elusimicrobia bacterium]|nr:hypothetical protein [Elusimicrobiota bacterium]